MGRDAEAGNVDADDANAVDRLGKQAKRHAGGAGDAKVGDDDRVVEGGIGEVVDRLADVLEQLAGDQRFRIERHVADGAPGPIEVRGEGQAIDAAGRAREHCRRAAHSEADAQAPKGRAHGLWLVVRDRGDSPWRNGRGSRSGRPWRPPRASPPCRHGRRRRHPSPCRSKRYRRMAKSRRRHRASDRGRSNP